MYGDLHYRQAARKRLGVISTANKERLLAAGATLENEMHLDDGSHLLMLRDPWGLALQFCKRGKTMLTETDRSV